MSNTSQIVSDLGALHRASVWENIVFNVGLTLKGIDIQRTPSVSPLEQSPTLQTAPLPGDPAGNVNLTGIPNLNLLPGDHPLGAPQPPLSRPSTSRDQNAEALKHITRGLPTSMSPFFQGKCCRKPTAVMSDLI